MTNLIKRFELTHEQAAEKELILDQIRINPRGPWVNGKKVIVPKGKRPVPSSKKKI